MKKISLIVLAGLALIFTSCTKIATNEKGFCIDGKSAAKSAKKNNQNVLVIATMAGDDSYSSDFITNVLEDSRFIEEIASEYTVLDLDFSRRAYEATVVKEDSSTKEQKIAEENADRMQQNTLFASRLNLQVLPSVYILSKDMYFITQLDFSTDEISNYDNFKSLLDNQKSVIDEFNAKIEATKKGTKAEKLAAIDNLFTSTDIVYRAFMTDLIDDYIKLDKNNETGLLSQYILAKADIESSNYFMAGDIDNAVKAYVKVAEDKRLSPEDRQNSYYLASYILVASSSTDFETIKNYLQLAIDAYPEGPNTGSIKTVLEQLSQLLASEEATAEAENSTEIAE